MKINITSLLNVVRSTYNTNSATQPPTQPPTYSATHSWIDSLRIALFITNIIFYFLIEQSRQTFSQIIFMHIQICSTFNIFVCSNFSLPTSKICLTQFYYCHSPKFLPVKFRPSFCKIFLYFHINVPQCLILDAIRSC